MRGSQESDPKMKMIVIIDLFRNLQTSGPIIRLV